MTLPHRKPRDASPAAVFDHIEHILEAALDRASAQPLPNRAAIYAAALIRIRATLPESHR